MHRVAVAAGAEVPVVNPDRIAYVVVAAAGGADVTSTVGACPVMLSRPVGTVIVTLPLP